MSVHTSQQHQSFSYIEVVVGGSVGKSLLEELYLMLRVYEDEIVEQMVLDVTGQLVGRKIKHQFYINRIAMSSC